MLNGRKPKSHLEKEPKNNDNMTVIQWGNILWVVQYLKVIIKILVAVLDIMGFGQSRDPLIALENVQFFLFYA